MSDEQKNYELGVTPPFDNAEWEFNLAIHDERARQLELGYTTKHDRKTGVRHLVNLAIDYIYRDEKVKAAAVVLALLSLKRTLNERKWFWCGVVAGAVVGVLVMWFLYVMFLVVTK